MRGGLDNPNQGGPAAYGCWAAVGDCAPLPALGLRGTLGVAQAGSSLPTIAMLCTLTRPGKPPHELPLENADGVFYLLGGGALLGERLAVWGAEAAAEEVATAVEEGGSTIGEILEGSHPDTMIHLTNDSASAFASGVDPGTFFARFGDVSKMTLPQYQSDVVGMGAAAGPGQPVSGFITAGPGNAGAFVQAGVWNNAGVMEYTNGARFIPDSYVPLP